MRFVSAAFATVLILFPMSGFAQSRGGHGHPHQGGQTQMKAYPYASGATIRSGE